MMPDMSKFCPPSLIEIHSAIEGDGERVISRAKIAASSLLKGFIYHVRGITFCALYVSFRQKFSDCHFSKCLGNKVRFRIFLFKTGKIIVEW